MELDRLIARSDHNTALHSSASTPTPTLALALPSSIIRPTRVRNRIQRSGIVTRERNGDELLALRVRKHGNAVRMVGLGVTERRGDFAARGAPDQGRDLGVDLDDVEEGAAGRVVEVDSAVVGAAACGDNVFAPGREGDGFDCRAVLPFVPVRALRVVCYRGVTGLRCGAPDAVIVISKRLGEVETAA